MKNYQKIWLPIIIAIVALLTLGGGAYIYNNQKIGPGIPPADFDWSSIKQVSTTTVDNNIVKLPDPVKITPVEPVACTMDALQCPDGSYVGRSGPKCEFVCPVVNKTSLAKDFLVKMQKDLSINAKIIERTLNYVRLPSGEYKTNEIRGYAFYPSGYLSFDNYFASNGLKLYGGGDATFKGFVSYNNNSIICLRSSERREVDLEKCKNTQGLNCEYDSFTEIFCADILNPINTDDLPPPPLGNSTLNISCGLEEISGCTDVTKKTCSYMTKCNTESVNSIRSDFYLIVEGKKIKILIDIETRLRFVMGPNETLQKWTDFYPNIQNHPFGGGMPFGATIYGDWINENTFKANWIKWTIG